MPAICSADGESSPSVVPTKLQFTKIRVQFTAIHVHPNKSDCGHPHPPYHPCEYGKCPKPGSLQIFGLR